MRRSQKATATKDQDHDSSFHTTSDAQPSTYRPSLPYSSPLGSATRQTMPTLRHDVAAAPPLNTRRQSSQLSTKSEDVPLVESSSPVSPDASLDELKEAISSIQRKNLGRLKKSATSSSPAKSNLRRTAIAASADQQAMSPSLVAAFATPLPSGAQSASTNSTESNESAKTIRGTALPTPNQYPLRTPSYPFPYVPAVRPPSLPFMMHQPFTTLSPTVSSSDVPTRANLQFLHDRYSSVSSQNTSVATPTFAPQSSDRAVEGASVGTAAPNLYDLVLQLNSDPALDTWWTTLTTILHEHYKVERASLALPADTTDIENVPWGQKAAYNASGIKSETSTDQSTNRSVSATSEASIESLSRLSETSDGGYLSAPVRPSIESRHSYAGYEHGRSEGPRISSPVVRPSATRRTTTHVSSLRRSSVTDRHQSPEWPTPIHEHPDEMAAFDFGEPVPEPSEEPCAVLLPTLRALNREQDPLLDSSGVNRVLERGRLVVLTRDFSNDLDRITGTSSNSGEQTPQDNSKSKDRNVAGAEYSGPVQNRNFKARPFGRGATTADGPDNSLVSEKVLQYEDYEQFPASPWSQSPAPSPAIQKDPEANPFFATGNLDEETFNPAPDVREDYAEFGQVEAIGIDKASTIIHIPLIHPLWSRKMLSEQGGTPIQQANGSHSIDVERRAPIAILSILSPDVPYSQTWIQSLKQLSPHMATSFHTGYQSTTMHERVVGALSRQQRSSRVKDLNVDQMTGLGVTFGLESLLYVDPDDSRSSTIGSVTSPSEYSGRSKHSPVGSVAAATPGVDSHVHVATSRRPGTPNAGLAMEGDDYFNVKKRMSLHRARSGGPVSLNQVHAQPTSRASSSDHRSMLRKIDTSPGRESAGTPARREPKKTRMRDEKSSPAEASPGRKRGQRSGLAGEAGESRHSVLHSHGADFSASFQSLPVAAMPRPSGGMYTRSTSIADVFDMPPPSERLLRTIIDSLPVQIFTAAPLSGRVTWVNSKFLVYRGHTPRQVIEDPWGTIHTEDLEEYKNEWQKSLQTGSQFQHKARLRRFDDNFRWFYVRAAPLRDKSQNIVHWVGTMIDLHDQYLAEMSAAKQQETAASESKYRALANSSPQIVFAATQSQGVTFCNTQWLVYSGQTEEQARGTGFMEHVYPDDLVKCKLPMFDSSGTPAANVPLTVPNLTRRSKSGSSSTTADSGESSDSNLTMTGVTTEADGKQMGQRKLSELATSGILRISKDATGRPSYSTEVRLRMKSGEYRWHLVRVLLAEPLLRDDAEVETWYGTCTDINDHKELEQTLKETMDAKSRFLSNMSHEIRTPLNGISGMANFLIDSNLTAEQMDHVNVIRASTEGLRDLINDILDLSKVEAGMITLNMDWLHIRSVIEEVNDLTSTLALDKGVELNYMVDGNVPSMVKGDKFRFRQVLLNVIGNAIKFTQKGEVFVHCRISPDEQLEGTSKSVLLQMDVIDTGRGFTEKEAERLFKRFSQIDGSSTRQHGGTGLGLVISMQLVELHGGHMTASGVPGEGSTFTFSIRFGLPTAEDRPPEPPSENEPPVVTPSTLEHPEPAQKSVSTSPGFYVGLDRGSSEGSPVISPDGTTPLSRTPRTSSRSSKSSQSSYTPEGAGAPIQLEKISDTRLRGKSRTAASPKSSAKIQARAYSILVICPLKWTRMATLGHLQVVLNHTVPHIASGSESFEDARKKLEGPDSFTFSHVVVILQDTEAVLPIIELILGSHTTTSLVIVANPVQKREIISKCPLEDFDRLASDRRLQFIGKPVKPSRLAVIFDPDKSRELSTDQNQHSAQKIALSQKRVFDEMTRRLGNKDIKVLLVEDNRINQMVMLKLLRRVSVEVETCLDGVQATDKVLSKPAEYFSIILLDLMMPNKDGYQTCRDIRQWEKENNYPNIPIVALSANVLDDVWQKCKEAGFNSYLTKPVEFKELSDVMTAFLDPVDPSQPMDFMSRRPDASPAYKRGG